MKAGSRRQRWVAVEVLVYWAVMSFIPLIVLVRNNKRSHNGRGYVCARLESHGEFSARLQDVVSFVVDNRTTSYAPLRLAFDGCVDSDHV
jgi:cobalamin biosynthesis protein CobD/CbiB